VSSSGVGLYASRPTCAWAGLGCATVPLRMLHRRSGGRARLLRRAGAGAAAPFVIEVDKAPARSGCTSGTAGRPRPGRAWCRCCNCRAPLRPAQLRRRAALVSLRHRLRRDARVCALGARSACGAFTRLEGEGEEYQGWRRESTPTAPAGQSRRIFRVLATNPGLAARYSEDVEGVAGAILSRGKGYTLAGSRAAASGNASTTRSTSSSAGCTCGSGRRGCRNAARHPVGLAAAPAILVAARHTPRCCAGGSRKRIPTKCK